MELSAIQPPLRFQAGTLPIWQRLSQLPRTGWVQWEIPNPETVAEHIMATRRLAISWREKIELVESDFEDLLAIIEVHDWPEVIVGDLVIMGDERNVISLRNEKRDREKAAMVQLCRDLPEGQEALALYERYEANFDEVARYAKQLDKMQAVLLAGDYAKQYERPGLLREFITYSEAYIDIPFLLEQLKDLKQSS